MDEETVLKPCPICECENLPMGDLGSLLWYRCQACGWEYSAQINEDVEETVKARPDKNE